ncbi:MAG: hypothetical protein ACLP9L_05735 [Thermoguttaceae bacterium]
MLVIVPVASRFPPSLFQAILLFVVLYVVKFRILTLHIRWWLAISLYGLLVAALLPYLRLLAAVFLLRVHSPSSRFPNRRNAVEPNLLTPHLEAT